ncbi:MAG: DUF1553 domain-containing protein [Planctomycetes bacterium]|nr:DUF1553 domain-containing protein [Planctomycetota bacterium]
MTFPQITATVLAVVSLLTSAMNLSAGGAKGLGEPGALKSLRIDTGRVKNGAFLLAGRDAWQQLQVAGVFASGPERDLTRGVTFSTTPAGIVKIDAAGLVTPLQEGKATITATHKGITADVDVNVTNLIDDIPVHFANQVVPLFTKYGCNAGGCHGKASGQNGFKLSLLGFEPEEDYEYVVKENRGRRILPSAPAHSMLLLKASGGMAHGGGKKIDPASAPYRIMLRWVEQGTPYGRASDPTVTGIDVFPGERLLDLNSQQQLTVIARMSDGSTVDVTRLSQFETNERELAQVDESGLISTKNLPGIVAVMARYQTHVAVFRALIPLGAPVAKLPAAKNFIDEQVYRQLQKLGLPPSELCDDGTFLRRVTIDIAGRLPTLDETRAFLADKDADRHAKLVDRLLASADYADLFASKWSAVLRNRRATAKEDARPTIAFHGWIREALDKNVPFDQFVRGVLTAKGEAIKSPPVIWYREVKDVAAQVEDVSQLFLGQRIACAKCHHHPLEKWNQQDYWSLAAFFTRVEVKAPKNVKNKGKKNKGPAGPAPSWVVNLKAGKAQATNPKTNAVVQPAGLAGPALSIPTDEDPRAKLVDWMADPKNPYFARTLANRYWKHFMGRGLVEPEDDLRATNPATNPELLDALARSFVDSKFDLKKLIRVICTSNAYRLSALPNAHNADDRQNYSRFLPRRLNAEILFDAIDAVTLTRPAFKGVPVGTRAVKLPDNQFESYFLSVFGRPDFASACECERSSDSSLAQSLHLMNSVELAKKVAGERARKLASDKRPLDERLGELYLVALSRTPSTAELTRMRSYLEARPASQGWEDLLWAVLNTKEFLYNH